MGGRACAESRECAPMPDADRGEALVKAPVQAEASAEGGALSAEKVHVEAKSALDKASEQVAMFKVPEDRLTEKEEIMKKLWADLVDDFPKLKVMPYAIFGIENPKVYYFLENSSLGTLLKLGIVNKAMFKYADVSENWCIASARNYKMIPYHEAVKAEPDVELNPERLYHMIEDEIQFLRPEVLINPKLKSSFALDLTPRILMAVFINENSAGVFGGGKKIKSKDGKTEYDPEVHVHSKGKMEFYRMLLEAGWQPQKMPASNRSDYKKGTVSFGIDQFTEDTMNGLRKKQGPRLDFALGPNFASQTSLESQIDRSLILAYDNLVQFEAMLNAKGKTNKSGLRKFNRIYGTASDADRSGFVMAIVAAMHNNGDKGTVNAVISAVLNSQYAALPEAKLVFLETVRKGMKGAGYTKRALKMYDVVSVYRNLGQWDPVNGTNFLEQKKVLDRNIDAVSLKDLGF